MDLASGYNQVLVAENDKPKTAFCTPFGLFEFNRMPFGICNVPSTFQQLMERMFGAQHFETLLLYLDDIIVFSASVDQHLQRLNAVLTRLHQEGLKVKMEKCCFFQTKEQNGDFGTFVQFWRRKFTQAVPTRDQRATTVADTSASEPVSDWLVEHQARLQTAFDGTRERIEMAPRLRKERHDRDVRDEAIAEGEVVHLRNTGIRGRNKIQDAWSPTRYLVVRAPGPGGGVYSIAPCDQQSKVKQVHHSLLKRAPPKFMAGVRPKANWITLSWVLMRARKGGGLRALRGLWQPLRGYCPR
ncbi:hypothetical protein ACEWY4_001339 [Coilia grayii]|uniref:ribonuclease H n=1 Tax=Coilia grayii TaxID=363190 RepID=A0ABD1KT37_9TELE